jgi:hypothetical protein
MHIQKPNFDVILRTKLGFHFLNILFDQASGDKAINSYARKETNCH